MGESRDKLRGVTRVRVREAAIGQRVAAAGEGGMEWEQSATKRVAIGGDGLGRDGGSGRGWCQRNWGPRSRDCAHGRE